ncbi:hypothetical protein [Cellulomonas sp. URHE0023]|uniref:hypothetical protein n=1 Tax=Cellulomonas sp. URHE0023 TaxID=1380354 RepID=UPI000485D42E|nr:hypothetical protein [Cellulomonas sp. URHE0023]
MTPVLVQLEGLREQSLALQGQVAALAETRTQVDHGSGATMPQTRLQRALTAREWVSPPDFFGGWAPEDVDLLARFRLDQRNEPGLGEIVDWLGIGTKASRFPGLSGPGLPGVEFVDLPIPDDGFHAEAIEYVALLTAVERAVQASRGTFSCVELGASYGPWVTAAGVTALRSGFDRVSLLAVEAAAAAEVEILEHAERNGLTQDASVDVRVVHAAVHVRDETVWFPRVDPRSDNGAQMSSTQADVDYRGHALEHDPVDGLSLRSLVEHLDRIDFLHMDLQGTEQSLLEDPDFLSVLHEKVEVLFLATQSRLIEGIALRELSRLGWALVRERPTDFRQNAVTSDPNGWTIRDGGQLWLNPGPVSEPATA